jgi:hypothetical protein
VLHAAVEEGNTDAVNFLLEHGLAIDAREDVRSTQRKAAAKKRPLIDVL